MLSGMPLPSSPLLLCFARHHTRGSPTMSACPTTLFLHLLLSHAVLATSTPFSLSAMHTCPLPSSCPAFLHLLLYLYMPFCLLTSCRQLDMLGVLGRDDDGQDCRCGERTCAFCCFGRRTGTGTLTASTNARTLPTAASAHCLAHCLYIITSFLLPPWRSAVKTYLCAYYRRQRWRRADHNTVFPLPVFTPLPTTVYQEGCARLSSMHKMAWHGGARFVPRRAHVRRTRAQTFSTCWWRDNITLVVWTMVCLCRYTPGHICAYHISSLLRFGRWFCETRARICLQDGRCRWRALPGTMPALLFFLFSTMWFAHAADLPGLITDQCAGTCCVCRHLTAAFVWAGRGLNSPACCYLPYHPTAFPFLSPPPGVPATISALPWHSFCFPSFSTLTTLPVSTTYCWRLLPTPCINSCLPALYLHGSGFGFRSLLPSCMLAGLSIPIHSCGVHSDI